MNNGIATCSLGRGLLLLALIQGLLAGNAVSFPPAGKVNASVATTAADLSISQGLFDSFLQGFYPLRVDNSGPDSAQNVVCRFPVPEGTEFVSMNLNIRSTCSIPPRYARGDIVCSLGDVAPNRVVLIDIVLRVVAPPDTKIAARASVSSETPDPNPDNNTYSQDTPVFGFPRINSVRVLRNPFRIEVTGENLLAAPFGIGVGCDCTNWPRELVRVESANAFVLEGGGELKKQFPPGIPSKICYTDPYRQSVIKFVVTR